MEFIDGGELFAKLAASADNTLTEHVAAVYMKKLFSALNHMHLQGITHRDIKPENIMLNKNDEIKLIDFGLSKR